MAVPEGPEIDTDKLRETIDEEIEKEGSSLLRTVALTTAILAALAAIASLKAGGTVNEATLPRLKCQIICGAANNQLANEAIGDEVEKRGILYAPDYAVNAGGVMNVSLEIDGYNRERAMRMMRTIYHNVGRIFQIAKRDSIPTYKAADRVAEERISAIGKIKLPTMGNHAPRFQGRMRGS